MIEEKVFSFIYDMAFKDATMRKAFPKGEDTDLVFAEKKKKVKNSLENTLQLFTHKLLAGCLTDAEYTELIKTIWKDGKSADERFSFGNAQKLVNMLSKYLYIACYDNDQMRCKFECCHCPMDSIMIRTVCDSYDKLGEELQEQVLNVKLKNVNWSTLGRNNQECTVPEAYEVFQRAVGKLKGRDLLSIEFDYENWGSN